jgi:fructokinase
MRRMPHRPVILALGEILWDLLPSGKQLGGAPANFAYHAARLGADARVVSAVGDDALGREILARLRAQNLDTSLIRTDAVHPTGTVTVALDAAGRPSYTIHEGVAWDFLEATPTVLDLASRAACVCFGTLAQRGPTSRSAIGAILAATPPAALRILDINFRQHYYDREVVDASLGAATLLKINDDELPELLALLGTGGDDRAIFDAYPRLTLIALTRGGRGSALIPRDGPRDEHAGHPAEPLVDTVGAGDAFTAALAVGLLAGRPLAQINDAANCLAAYVCTRAGATPVIPDALRSGLLA